jgi:single-strand DNA-binding protein
MYLNRLTIRGFLGNDAETRSTASGKTYISLSIATKTSWKDDKNEWQSLTEWHRAVVWGESLAKYAATLKTGDFVQVEGTLRSREYEDKDGVMRRIWECKADSVLQINRPERAETAAAADQQPVSEEVPL